MMIKRIIATFLAALMLFASFAIVVNAEETSTSDEPVYEFNTGKDKPAMNYLTGEYTYKDEEGNTVKDVVDTKEEKLALMDLRLVKGDYRLYVDAYSGEVAVEQISTGEILFTNPYNTSSSDASRDAKVKMLSQIIVSYKNTKKDGTGDDNFNSFLWAVNGGDDKYEGKSPSQLNVRYIKDGIRVEYTLGRTNTRYLVPDVMEAIDFQTQILDVATANGCPPEELTRFTRYFGTYDLSDPKLPEESKTSLLARYPMLQKKVDGETVNVAIRVNNSNQGGVRVGPEYTWMENFIIKYCPDFTYETIDNLYRDMGYVATEEALPQFKLSLEYTLDDKGLSVRLPASGIRFDESIFQLDYIEILPYMGSAFKVNEGYTFFPDGSGTLFDFSKLSTLITTGETKTISGTIYGDDFGYYHISNLNPHSQVIRYPVFGLVKTEADKTTGEKQSGGFVAFVEEGDTMMKLESVHTRDYHQVRMVANPRPSDKVKPSGSAEAWTVVSERKYTGDYRIRYTILSNKNNDATKGGYTADYVGMAKAYRDYLIANGTLTKLTAADVKENLPIYIETFGAIETTKKFLSIPYKTNVALTSFSNIKTMYDELSKNGVDNINFILTGYGKGGLINDTIPYKLKWDSSVKKGYDFEDLLNDANGKFGVYPDFDFAYSSNNTLFDGLTLNDHAIKTIDGRYSSKQEYSAIRQAFVNYHEIAISPAYFSRFYEKLTGEYLESNPQGISVSTLGSSLNSDFDEDEPYNREDAKQFTTEAFKYFSENYDKVITSGGNAFAWKYVDVITDIATDSSRYSISGATVPFLGIVLHGFVETATTPINMEGNIDYAILRAIENGSAVKFMLSYDNTELLKEYSDTSVYYSIRYDIWLAEVIERYNEINGILKDVQTSTIEKHQFISGVRIPENQELYNDAESQLADAIAKEKADSDAAQEEIRVKLQKLRRDIISYDSAVAEVLSGSNFGYGVARNALAEAFTAYETAIASKKTAEDAVKAATEAYDAAKAAAEAAGATDEQKAAAETAKTALDNATKAAEEAAKAPEELLAKVKSAYVEYLEKVEAVGFYANVNDAYNAMRGDFGLFEKYDAYTPEIISELNSKLDNVGLHIYNFKAVSDVVAAEAKIIADKFAESYPELLPPVEEAKPEEETKQESTTAPVAEAYDKYAVNDSTIVYEQYSNERTFVLNFNDFAVKVKVDGVYYTVAAYGYIKIK